MKIRFGILNTPNFPGPNYLVRRGKSYDIFSTGYHETRLFRDAMMFDLPKFLQRTYSEKTNILSYASSGGHEPCSLAISLVEELGSFREVSNRFHIHAMDINPSLIEFNKDGFIILSNLDRETFPDFDECKFDNFFTNPEEVMSSQYGDILYPMFGRGDYASYEISNDLRESITFSHSDLWRDLENGNPLFDKPVVLMFRNAWFNYSLNAAERIADLFKERLKPGSLVILGQSETTNFWWLKNNRRVLVPEILEQRGFRDLKAETYEITQYVLKEGYLFLKE